MVPADGWRVNDAADARPRCRTVDGFPTRTPFVQDAAPTTFLFTDIEGSTGLWEQAPEPMRHALAAHDALARTAIEGHRGVVVKMTGDGVHAAFRDPVDAVLATVA